MCCRHVLRPLQHSLRRPRPSQAPCANGRSGVAPQGSGCSRQIRCSSSLASSRPIRCTPCTACHALGANSRPTMGCITGGPSCSAPSPIWLGRRHATRARSPPATSCWRAPPCRLGWDGAPPPTPPGCRPAQGACQRQAASAYGETPAAGTRTSGPRSLSGADQRWHNARQKSRR